MIGVLVPSERRDYEQQLRQMVRSNTLKPFDSTIVEFIDLVSKTVLKDSAMRSMPEMVAVAYWMRRAHLTELRQSYDLQRRNRVWLPRGIALHFAPSNVDSIFLYSWFISLMVGNSNVVRLSQRRGAQVDVLLATIDAVLREDRFEPIRNRTLVLSYEHDDLLTRTLSEACHVRVLWGGDESIRRLRAIPVNPLATEIAFANRFSLAVLDAATVLRVDESQIAVLAGQFYNDAYWFDQMACSSPRLVVWVGTQKACTAAQEMFWEAVSTEIQKRGLQYAEMVGLNKLVSAYLSAAEGACDRILPGVTSQVSRIHLASRGTADFRSISCGGGLFCEIEMRTFDEVRDLLTERDQTLAYFGFAREDLVQFALSLPTRAIDRIVPIGKALDFSTVWDGNSLFELFSREIDLH